MLVSPSEKGKKAGEREGHGTVTSDIHQIPFSNSAKSEIRLNDPAAPAHALK